MRPSRKAATRRIGLYGAELLRYRVGMDLPPLEHELIPGRRAKTHAANLVTEQERALD